MVLPLSLKLDKVFLGEYHVGLIWSRIFTWWLLSLELLILEILLKLYQNTILIKVQINLLWCDDCLCLWLVNSDSQRLFNQILISALKLLLFDDVCNRLFIFYQGAWTENPHVCCFDINRCMWRFHILFNFPLLLLFQMNTNRVCYFLRKFEWHYLAKLLLVWHFLKPNVF